MMNFLCGALLSACASSPRTMNAMAPLPPLSDTTPNGQSFDMIQTSTGVEIALNNAAKKSCRFSSFQRNNTLGYELDESRQIGFNISPSFDVFNPSDIDVKIGFKFTKALGGPANKRPDCTYGSGYYGLLPFAVNEGVSMGSLTDGQTLRGFIQEKLHEREQRRKEREEKLGYGI